MRRVASAGGLPAPPDAQRSGGGIRSESRAASGIQRLPSGSGLGSALGRRGSRGSDWSGSEGPALWSEAKEREEKEEAAGARAGGVSAGEARDLDRGLDPEQGFTQAAAEAMMLSLREMDALVLRAKKQVQEGPLIRTADER